ncbi:uncharacterized protein LOC118734608 [Rhagoletis pomonella]|uniref:uncharacterized protein LOC118734608 n=1 Tax=Rhagoletis pomonella TaxID=28610 RepID=UPI0017807E02|nr:uncharacterized protein LOC118734608 [Rhagoletis pomonella]
MNKVQILLALALVACFCVTLTKSLSCYICDSSSGQNCNHTTTTATCNSSLAQQTVNYGVQYLNANLTQLNATSSTYNCVYDLISAGTTNHTYLGCVYSTVNICNFTPRSYTARHCLVCSGNNCNRNPADRATGSIFTLTAAIVLAFVAKIMYN